MSVTCCINFFVFSTSDELYVDILRIKCHGENDLNVRETRVQTLKLPSHDAKNHHSVIQL